VEATYAHAPFLEGVDGSDMVVSDVPFAAITINYYCRDPLEKVSVPGPAWIFRIMVYRGVEIKSTFVQSLGQQQGARVVFMREVAVALLAGDEKNLSVLR
tara:strand:+ start:611 stop:910 length:300 start_codon:yes stop_codon:yes gene_type:complete